MKRDHALRSYLNTLQRVPSVRSASLEETGARRAKASGEARLKIVTPSGRHDFLVEVKNGVLNAAMEERVLSLLSRHGAGKWMLFAPYVTPRLAERLAELHVNFVDLAGNCHLELGPSSLIHIVGRGKQPREPRTGLSSNGYRVLHALLAKPGLGDATVRELASAAGVGKSTAAEAVKALERLGLLHSTSSGRVLLGNNLLDRWVAGYADQLRPALFIARYQPADPDPAALIRRIEDTLRRKRVKWAFSGGAGAERLTKHYRGETTVVHLERPVPELVRELRLAPTPEGSLTMLLAPGPIAFDAAPKAGVAPAALVYAELLAAGGERAGEAAERVRERYLAEFA